MKSLSQFLSVIFLLAFTGCVAVLRPGEDELRNVDYGPEPTELEINTSVKSFFEFRLKDSSSAQYRFGKPEKYFIRNRGDQFIYGAWRVYVFVNAKNGYGGYAGFQQHGFLFRYGKIERERVMLFDVEDWKTVL